MLEIENIEMNYGATHVLKNLSFTVASGSFLAIVGPSGCGKTTLMRLIAGLNRPTSGVIKWNHVMVNSKDESTPVNKRNIGMVFQSFALWPHMRVHQQVMYPLNSDRFRHWTKDQKKARVLETIKNCGLETLMDRYPHELSGGQQQRVALARAIVGNPDVLLMDEPLSALDAQLRIEMRQEIQRIHRLTKATIVYITHDQSEAMTMADTVIVMNEGRIEQLDSPQELYLHPKTIFSAQFIGKYNLLPGTWHHHVFTVQDTSLRFTRNDVSESFISANVCPVRPEQFQVTDDQDGLACVVCTVQYLGAQYHYQMRCGHMDLNVTLGIDQLYSIGDTVWLKVRT